MIGSYYLITSVSLSEAKLRTVCLELRICVLKWPLLESSLMSVNDCVHQVFVLKMMDGAISAIKSRCGLFWLELMSKTWHTVV